MRCIHNRRSVQRIRCVSFTIIPADDYDAAVAIARACPPGHTIEIREFAGYA